MKPYKTPNLDGFQCIFFKQYCHIVGDVIFCLVKTTVHTGYFDPAISETLITLIPKINPRTTFKDFRPINLCKFVYKIITKVLVLRLRPILNSIIKPYQGSSLPGRGTSDHAIVLLEIIHFMRKSKKKKGFVAFKLELEKAFDNFNWDFLKSQLKLTHALPLKILDQSVYPSLFTRLSRKSWFSASGRFSTLLSNPTKVVLFQEEALLTTQLFCWKSSTL
jgi:hypothetical protein